MAASYQILSITPIPAAFSTSVSVSVDLGTGNNRAILVLAFLDQPSAGQNLTGVTAGGVALTGGPTYLRYGNTADMPHRLFTLVGSSVPTGVKTVAITSNNSSRKPGGFVVVVQDTSGGTLSISGEEAQSYSINNTFAFTKSSTTTGDFVLALTRSDRQSTTFGTGSAGTTCTASVNCLSFQGDAWYKNSAAGTTALNASYATPNARPDLVAVTITSTNAGGGGDVTAPVLSSPVSSSVASTTATVGVTTDDTNGTLYSVITASNTAPSVAQIQAGQNDLGIAAVWSGNQVITSAGAKTFSATGLTSGTTYYVYFQHKDAAGNDSLVSSAGFTTAIVDVTSPTMTGSLTVGTVTTSSIQVSWLAASDNLGGTLTYETSLDGTTWTDRGTALTYTFTGLTAGTSYTLRVRAKDPSLNVSTALSVVQSTSAIATGVLNIGPLKNNTGTLLANETGVTVIVNTLSGVLVVNKTAQTSNSTGMVQVSDAAITTGTTYRVVIALQSGDEGMDKIAAS